ncbi:MAG: TIGR04133 family radical SAM/SPASM protein [Bacteroidales bacterium]
MATSLSIKQRFLLEVFRRFRHNEARLHPLLYLFWECTLRCNLSCLHCGSDCLTDASVSDMPAVDFLRSTAEIARVHPPGDITVVLTGGEPLLRKDLESIGLSLRKQGFRWGLVTNGFQLSEGRLKSLLSAGLGAITVSLDGLEPEHNWLRNHPDSHRRALESIRLVARERRLNADVVTCVNQRNIETLKDIQTQLAETGLRAWRLFTISPIGRAAGEPDLQINHEQFIRLMEFIAENRRNQDLPRASFSCESYIGPYEGRSREGFFFCRAGIHIGSILADGGISACPNIDRSLVQGNIYQDDFNAVWEERFQPFRDRSWTRRGPCDGCKSYPYCEGSGLHEWDFKAARLRRCLLIGSGSPENNGEDN